MLRIALTIIQVFSAISIMALVLLQRGKGAEAGTGFGAGASGTVFGARGSANFLSRATGVLATVFFITSLALASLSTQRTAPSSLLDAPAQTAPAPQAPASNAPPAAPGASDLPQLPSDSGSAPAGNSPPPATGPDSGGGNAPNK